MKRFLLSFMAFFCAMMLIGTTTSCSNNNKGTAAKTVNGKKADSSTLPNYRYVDLDTILERYNLAKDYSEQMLRLRANLENEARKHQTNIGSFAQSMDNKYKNHGYLSEASFNQDQQQLANMQNNAERQLSQMEQSFQEQYNEAQRIINDSIQAFIKTYNQSHGYDAIFIKATTLYINPDLDITQEVIEGLNATYNKVKK